VLQVPPCYCALLIRHTSRHIKRQGSPPPRRFGVRKQNTTALHELSIYNEHDYNKHLQHAEDLAVSPTVTFSV
jgi:hypothetical protein